MSTELFAPMAIPALRNADLERHEASARARGYAAGYAEGLRAASVLQAARAAEAEAEHAAEAAIDGERLTRAIAALRMAALDLQEHAIPAVAEVEETLAAAAVELAGAIVGYELSDTAGSARAALTRVLAADIDGAVSVVRMNPGDLSLLTDGATGAVGVSGVSGSRGAAGVVGVGGAGDPDGVSGVAGLRGAGAPDGVRFVADRTLNPGDAVGELPDGWLDARITTALDRARAALLGGAR